MPADKNELLRIYNIKRKFIGYEERKTVHDQLLLHNEVALWIINPSSKSVLLEKRSPNKRLNANKWSLCAGHVVLDETLEQALYKETFEEIGIDLNNYNPKKLITVIRDEYCNYCFSHHYYIIADIKLDEFVIQKEELVAVEYFNYEQLKEEVRMGNQSLALIWNSSYKKIFKKLDHLIK